MSACQSCGGTLGRDCFDTQQIEPEHVASQESRKRLDEMRASRDAWRAACRFLCETIGEGGSNGRPIDLIPKPSYRQIVGLISKAELLEPESLQKD